MERIQQLAALIAELNYQEGSHPTAIPDVYLTKMSTTDTPRHTVDRAVFCVVAQGQKSIWLNNQRCVYDSSKYLVVSLDLPLVGQVMEATRQKPFLGISMVLDFAEISSLILEADLPLKPDSEPQKSLVVSPMDEDLLDAVIRLACLLKKPAQIPILAPLIRREIFYKLLCSEQSGFLRRMAVESSQVRRIATALEWLKRNAAKPIRMDELARQVHMSTSTMHFWFKAVTAMSPLQFQKQLRLQEARRILLSEATDAATASQRVGYRSASQFNREYRRLFGFPPLRDLERLRAVQRG